MVQGDRTAGPRVVDGWTRWNGVRPDVLEFWGGRRYGIGFVVGRAMSARKGRGVCCRLGRAIVINHRPEADSFVTLS